MAQNIFSRALLSIFMDKKARATYDAVQETKKKKKKGSKAITEAPAASSAPEPVDDDDVLPETLIHRAIEQASQELERKKNLPPGRQALIEQALAIHDQKSALLDDLPKEQREKLMVMAMHAFGADLDKADKPKTKRKTPKRKKP